MAFLVVGGVTVPVSAPSGAHEKLEVFIDRARMQDTSMAATVIGTGYKRQWPIVTRSMLDADASTLRTVLVNPAQPIACSGDLPGGAVNCFAELTGYEPVWTKAGIRRRVSFTLYEA